MRLTLRLLTLAAVGGAFFCPVSAVHAALATGVTGFYYTGESTSGTPLGQGANTPTVANSGQQDASWSVSYASTNGGISAASAYEGTSYVINTTNTTYGTQYPVPYWSANTTQAEWITAPGATWANSANTGTSGAINSGGDGLLGYGTDTSPVAYNNSHSVVYVYTTTFTLTSTAAVGTAITGLTLNLQVSADNSYAIFVNPSNSGAFLSTSTAKYISGANAYGTSSAIALSTGFVVGVNTISIEVQNAGTSASYQTNYSGLLVYGGGFIGIPEYGTWFPLALATAAYGAWGRWGRRRANSVLVGRSGRWRLGFS